MTQSTDPRLTVGWFSNIWICPVCHTQIRKNHKARHLEGLKHKRLLNDSGYTMMPSDLAFAEFLHGVGPWDLSPYEMKLYLKNFPRKTVTL